MIKYVLAAIFIFLMSSCFYYNYSLYMEDAPSNISIVNDPEFRSILYRRVDIIPGLKIEIQHLEKSWNERKGNAWESSIYVEYEDGEKDIKIVLDENTLNHKNSGEILPSKKSITFWNSNDNYVIKNSTNAYQTISLISEIPRNTLSISNIYNIDNPPKELHEYIDLQIIVDGEVVIIKFDFIIKYSKQYNIVDVWMSV